jgi:DNA-binding PadR family transcriptional regulator
MSKDWSNPYSEMWPWSFLGRRSRFFESGEVRLAILSLLNEGPKHGYQVMKAMEERSGGLYRASAGSVYPTLQQLVDEELIQSEAQDGKRVYTITDAGRTELAKDPEAVNRIWRRAEHWEEWKSFRPVRPFNPALMHTLMTLMKDVWQAAARLSAQPGGADKVRSVLERTCHELEQMS